ncbi:hypothetical protein P9209_15450 [Prescottella defluvii]|nr:hypothetical protein P9209_15450 [Prescottella defluvii]
MRERCSTENEKDKHLKLRKMTIAGVAIAAALTMSACSNDSSSTERTTAQQTTATTAAAEPTLAPPTADQLNADLTKAFDESVPLDQKVALVQGAQADPELINQVIKAAKDNGATIRVVDVTPTGADTVTAGVTMTINGQDNPATVDFVAENGIWKMSNSYACGLVKMANLTSPACPA